MPAVRMPPSVAKKAVTLFFDQPLMRYIVAARTMPDVRIEAATGPVPRKIMGKKRNTKQIKVNTKATADLTPFLPPTTLSKIRKAAMYR